MTKGNNPHSEILEVPDRVSPAGFNIPVYIDNEGYRHVNEDRRAEGKEAYIDEKHPDPGTGYAHSFPQ